MLQDTQEEIATVQSSSFSVVSRFGSLFSPPLIRKSAVFVRLRRRRRPESQMGRASSKETLAQKGRRREGEKN